MKDIWLEIFEEETHPPILALWEWSPLALFDLVISVLPFFFSVPDDETVHVFEEEILDL